MAKPIQQLVPDLRANLKAFIREQLAPDIKTEAEGLTPRGETRFAYTQWRIDSTDSNNIKVVNLTDYLNYPEEGTVYQERQLFTWKAVNIATLKNRKVNKK